MRILRNRSQRRQYKRKKLMRKLFSVYDSKVKTYLDPFIAMNQGEAYRIMEDLTNRPGTMFNSHSEDFTLFELGEWNDSTGQITQYETKKPIIALHELKKESGPKTTLQSVASPAQIQQ